jgi:asparagine synthase (glutamine-hydrolysing)
MCGITGIYNFEASQGIEQQTLRKMTDVLHHRGPDGSGLYAKENVGLGHRRLSIIDLTTGDQPMFNKDKSIAIVLNGEIYNYIELREQLIKLGCRFTTTSDTEVVIQAYETWGVDCLEKFNGMWAFALWDDRKKQLFISRDRIGEKPVFYSTWNNSLVFGSEIKSLFEFGVDRTPMLELLEVYMVTTSIPSPFTFYKHIHKLSPGHYIIANASGFKEHKYWDLPEIDEDNMLTDKQFIYEQFENMLTDSVKIRMRSDVPYGAFLSGGLDSSSIVALMSEISSYPVNTFTIGFDDSSFDESKLAQEVADKFKTKHFLGTVEPESFEEMLAKVVFHYDEPFGDSSAIPTGYVSKFAAQEVKMVLTGDGGDEVLSGYRSYVGQKFVEKYNRVPSFVRKKLPGLVKASLPLYKGRIRYKMNRTANVLESANWSFLERLVNKKAYTSLPLIETLTADIKDVIPIRDYFQDFLKTCTYKDDFYKMMYLNFKYDLPNDYLVKVDRMSMAHSLETRVPFLDHRLIEFMVQVHKDVKLQGWKNKSILRETVARKLPKNLMSAPKRGFGVPVREWFKQDSFNKQFADLMKLGDIIDINTLKTIVSDNREGKRDNGNFIWGLFVLNEILKKV